MFEQFKGNSLTQPMPYGSIFNNLNTRSIVSEMKTRLKTIHLVIAGLLLFVFVAGCYIAPPPPHRRHRRHPYPPPPVWYGPPPPIIIHP